MPVFAYGTLRDARYLTALFDRIPPCTDATLAGWRVVVAEGGYFSVVEDPHGSVAGTLVTLSEADLERADRWEDVPLYARRRVTARGAGHTATPCWLYVRETAAGETPPAGALSLHSPERVLQAIRAFRRSDATRVLSLESPD